ncbi:phospholipase [Kitasatospora sp. NPDC051853]|uniref:phospholipase n=1 Tax=Kitasatospora sp. NPDC051853 TaxID=3364058 RepID=UPI0037886147
MKNYRSAVVGGLVLAAAVTVAVPAPASAAGGGLTRLGRLGQLVDSVKEWNGAYANRAKDPWKFDWSTDGCSHVPDNPLGFNFKYACHRHDFGYRNYKALVGRTTFNAKYKAHVDDVFLRDMNTQCVLSTAPGSNMQVACLSFARAYYTAVKNLGS